MQISPGIDWRHAAAAEDGLTLVVAGIAHQGTEDGQPAVKVTQTAAHQHAVLTPCDAQLDQRSTERQEQIKLLDGWLDRWMDYSCKMIQLVENYDFAITVMLTWHFIFIYLDLDTK